MESPVLLSSLNLMVLVLVRNESVSKTRCEIADVFSVFRSRQSA